MQEFETRMRRAVQKENDSMSGSSLSSSLSREGQQQQQQQLETTNNQKRRRRGLGRQKNPIISIRCGLILTILSPVVILSMFIFSAQIMTTLRRTYDSSAELVSVTTLSSRVTVHGGNGDVNGDKNSKTKENNLRASSSSTKKKTKNNNKEILVLVTKHGDIRIRLRPDLSEGSVDYIYKLVASYGEGQRCLHCNLYRSEQQGILQGIMENKKVVPVNTVLGTCPDDDESSLSASKIKNNCPEWDQDCGCHGPIMTRGAVAWAAGQAGGPDFFIDGYKEPAKFWGTQHTNFGRIDDAKSFDILDHIFSLPTKVKGDMEFLLEAIHFDLKLE